MLVCPLFVSVEPRINQTRHSHGPEDVLGPLVSVIWHETIDDCRRKGGNFLDWHADSLHSVECCRVNIPHDNQLLGGSGGRHVLESGGKDFGTFAPRRHCSISPGSDGVQM